MLGVMRIRSLDLHKALRANGLVTAPCLIEIRRIVHEADRTLRGIFVQIDFDGLSIHIWILLELYLPRRAF